MKKHNILIISLILAFSFFIIVYLKPNNYELRYKVNNIDILERYISNKKYYTFNIYYKDYSFEIISFDKYTSKRNLIEDLSIKEEDNRICTNIIKSRVSLYNVCYDNGYKVIINNDTSYNEIDSFNNISINNLNNKKYLLWNYHDFIYLSNNKKETINIFNKDIYNLNLCYQFNNYLLIPDYEQEYEFNKMYLLNINKLKKEKMSLRFPLYYDSYYLGNDNKNIYLYDIKNEQEYFINPKKKDIYKTSNKILNNNKWEKTTTQKLKNNKLSFKYDYIINYSIKDNKLFMNDKIQVSDLEISKVVKQNNFDVYFLSKDILYYFNPLKGLMPLLKYSEWNFNYQNMIFIFD